MSFFRVPGRTTTYLPYQYVVSAPSVHLCVHDGDPQQPRLDGSPGEAFGLVRSVQGFELVAEHVGEPRRLVGAKQAPVPVCQTKTYGCTKCKVQNAKCKKKNEKRKMPNANKKSEGASMLTLLILLLLCLPSDNVQRVSIEKKMMEARNGRRVNYVCHPTKRSKSFNVYHS